MEYYIKLCQENSLTAKNSPILYIVLNVLQIIFLYMVSTWLDYTHESGNYFLTIAIIPVLTHFIAWIFAYKYSTGHFFDLNGEITVLITVLYSISWTFSMRKLIINIIVLIWDIRLGLFAFNRMLVRGADFRFESMKHSACFYLFAHIAQALWVFLIGSCVWIFNLKETTNSNESLNIVDIFGLIIYLIGFIIEILSDQQKYSFNKKYKSGKNKKWIENGLWSICRHPNYFGEITLWFGICIMCSASPNVYGIDLLYSWITPIWAAYFLITTSLPLLEGLSDKRFGKNPRYWIYKKKIPVLVPFIC